MTCIGCIKLSKRLSNFRKKIIQLEDRIQELMTSEPRV